MFRLRTLLAVLRSLAAVQSARGDEVGYLKSDKGVLGQEVLAYEPHEGDLIFCDDHNAVWGRCKSTAVWRTEARNGLRPHGRSATNGEARVHDRA